MTDNTDDDDDDTFKVTGNLFIFPLTMAKTKKENFKAHKRHGTAVPTGPILSDSLADTKSAGLTFPDKHTPSSRCSAGGLQEMQMLKMKVKFRGGGSDCEEGQPQTLPRRDQDDGEVHQSQVEEVLDTAP